VEGIVKKEKEKEMRTSSF